MQTAMLRVCLCTCAHVCYRTIFLVKPPESNIPTLLPGLPSPRPSGPASKANHTPVPWPLSLNRRVRSARRLLLPAAVVFLFSRCPWRVVVLSLFPGVLAEARVHVCFVRVPKAANFSACMFYNLGAAATVAEEKVAEHTNTEVAQSGCTCTHILYVMHFLFRVAHAHILAMRLAAIDTRGRLRFNTLCSPTQSGRIYSQHRRRDSSRCHTNTRTQSA